MSDWSAYRDRLLNGDCAVAVYTRSDAHGMVRVGIATVDLTLGVLFLRGSRYLGRSSVGWTATSLPKKRTKDEMDIGAKVDFLLPFVEVHELYFLDESVWRKWLEEERG